MWPSLKSSLRDDSNEWSHHRVWFRNKKVSILKTINFTPYLLSWKWITSSFLWWSVLLTWQTNLLQIQSCRHKIFIDEKCSLMEGLYIYIKDVKDLLIVASPRIMFYQGNGEARWNIMIVTVMRSWKNRAIRQCCKLNTVDYLFLKLRYMYLEFCETGIIYLNQKYILNVALETFLQVKITRNANLFALQIIWTCKKQSH